MARHVAVFCYVTTKARQKCLRAFVGLHLATMRDACLSDHTRRLARHVMGCHYTQEIGDIFVIIWSGGHIEACGRSTLMKRGFKMRVDDVAGNVCLSHVKGCHFIQETNDHNSFHDVADNCWLALGTGPSYGGTGMGARGSVDSNLGGGGRDSTTGGHGSPSFGDSLMVRRGSDQSDTSSRKSGSFSGGDNRT